VLSILHRYLLRQVFASLLLTAAVVSAVLIFGNALREILPLLISRQVTLGLLAKAFLLLVPFVWVFALPMGMLTATLLVFGRFSADQELTAARASGISLLSLATPILIFSLLLCGVSAVMNMEVAPRCRVAYKEMRHDFTAMLNNLQLPEGRPIKDFKDLILYIGKNPNGELEDVKVFFLQDETNMVGKVDSPRGRLRIDTTNQIVTLLLFDTQGVSGDGTDSGRSGDMEFTFDLSTAQKAAQKPAIRDMTFFELRRELREMEQRISPPLALDQARDPESMNRKDSLKKEQKSVTERMRVQLHRQIAFSFACFGFTLVGIPLGIRAHRRETNAGIAMTLVLVMIYYGLIITAQSFYTRPELVPHLFMWLPNFIFQAVGAVLLWRANRGI
jgi:lipopolysaccharide export system permease protein